MDPAVIIENIRHSNYASKLQNELDYINNGGNVNIFSNSSDYDIDERKQTLEKLVNGKIETPSSETNKTTAKDDLFKEIDKLTYKKQWNKLFPFHKIVKIKEYVSDHVEDQKLQEEIIEEMTKYANEGRINTKKYVVYDPNSEKILSFPCLIVDNNKNTFQIKIV